MTQGFSIINFLYTELPCFENENLKHDSLPYLCFALVAKSAFQSHFLNMIIPGKMIKYFVNIKFEKFTYQNTSSKFRECASNLKNVGAEQVGKEKIVTSVSDLLIVSMVFVMSLLNANVMKVSVFSM